MPLNRRTMRASLSTTYLVPAFLLNPVILLHSLNTILSRILPPVAAAAGSGLAAASSSSPEDVVEPLYTPLGPSPRHPHLDVHASDSFCWSYTLVMVVVQMIAFTKVIDQRAALERRQQRQGQRQQKDGKTRTRKGVMAESKGAGGTAGGAGRGGSEVSSKSESSGSDDGSSSSRGQKHSRGRKRASGSGFTSREPSGGEAF